MTSASAATSDMVKTVRGLVLREVPYKESSRILTVLTDTDGKLTVSANGTKRKNSRTAAASQLLAYSEMTLSGSRGKWYLNEATVIEMFEELRLDMRQLALGTYFAELLETVGNEDMPDPEILRLGLNSLYLLSRRNYPAECIKPAFELKLMCLAGYEPMLEACSVCGEPEPERPFFDTEGGAVCCESCRGAVPGRKYALCPDSLRAMRHILSGDGAASFRFSIPPEASARIVKASEEYVSCCVERRFRSLEYYYDLEL